MCAAARRDHELGTRLRREEQGLERAMRDRFEASPLVYCHEHGGFLAAPGYKLGTVADARIQQLTEASFRILDRP